MMRDFWNLKYTQCCLCIFAARDHISGVYKSFISNSLSTFIHLSLSLCVTCKGYQAPSHTGLNAQHTRKDGAESSIHSFSF